MDPEIEKELDEIIERARALKALPPSVRGQEQSPKNIHEFRLKQLDFITEQVQYIRGLLIVKHREQGVLK